MIELNRVQRRAAELFRGLESMTCFDKEELKKCKLLSPKTSKLSGEYYSLQIQNRGGNDLLFGPGLD